jgi:hypothetical protein
MMGTSSLINYASDVIYNHLNDKELNDVAALHVKLIKRIKNRSDWLLPFIGQYDERFMPSIEDSYFYWDLCQKIYRGEIFITMVSLNDWAFSDKEFNCNAKNLIKEGFEIQKDTLFYEDARFNLTFPIKLKKLYLNDELTPKNPEEIIIKNMNGVVEFGTTSFAKTVSYLQRNINVCRVPYGYSFDSEKMKTLKPHCMILHNTKDLFDIDYFN